MPKQLIVATGPNPYVRHYRVIATHKKQIIRGKEVSVRPDFRLQSLVTPLLVSRDIVDTHAKNGDLAVFVKTIESWERVDKIVLDKIYSLLDINTTDRHKLPVTRV